MLSMSVIAFLPRSKCLLISWLQSASAVVLEPKQIKSATVFIVFPSICHGVMGPDAMIFHALEKEMATHSSVLAWRIPGTGSLVGHRLWGRTELDTTEAT